MTYLFENRKYVHTYSFNGKTDSVFSSKYFPYLKVYKICGWKYKFSEFSCLAIIEVTGIIFSFEPDNL